MEKEVKIIPSPYPVVTSYEKESLKVFKNNLAAAIDDVLRYIARAAATTIKEGINIGDIITQPVSFPSKKKGGEEIGKADDTDIEKARPKKWNVGDTHPQHPDWIWTEYAPGKYDWKSVKGKHHKGAVNSAPKPKTKYRWGEVLPEIDKMDAKQIQEHLIQKGILIDNPYAKSELDKADIKTAKSIASSLIKLYEKIPFQPIQIQLEKLGRGTTMDAAAGYRVRMRKDYFTNFDPKKYYKSINTDWRKNNEDAIKFFEENIKSYEEALAYMQPQDPNNPTDQELENIKKLEDSIKYAKEKIKSLQDKLKANPCWTVGEEETLASDIFLHEMGHILNGQCTGSCGVWKVPKYDKTYSDTERALHLQLNKERDEIFERYKKEPEHISGYSQTKNVEFFAECFVYWIKEDKRLPKYIRDYYDKYFKLTTPKFKFL